MVLPPAGLAGTAGALAGGSEPPEPGFGDEIPVFAADAVGNVNVGIPSEEHWELKSTKERLLNIIYYSMMRRNTIPETSSVISDVIVVWLI